MPFFDAHCHLQDRRLEDVIPGIATAYERLGLESALVNGTSESDWQTVRQISKKIPAAMPSYGLHPWKVSERSIDWQKNLEGFWQDPNSLVGEIGLDRWVEGYDIDEQMKVFLWQLRRAVELGKPVTIHCLKAWGLLFDTLRAEQALPSNGFLLHSYGGPKEMVQTFVNLGAYFSISGYFAFDRKRNQQEVFKSIPVERLLVETDAPDMLGPLRTIHSPLDIDGKSVNNPLNIQSIYAFAAELWGMELENFKAVIADNFRRFVCHN